MSRQLSPWVTRRNEDLLERIRALTAAHPVWGYRRIWAYLHCVEQRPVHKTRVLRLMREHQLLLTFNRRLQAKRTPTRSKPKPRKPHEWWGVDMTSDAIVRRYHIAPIDETQVRADIDISPVSDKKRRMGVWRKTNRSASYQEGFMTITERIASNSLSMVNATDSA
jgi:HTH-like domain